MNVLRKTLAAEVHRVFLNQDEFGELVELAGARVPAVVESFELELLPLSDDRQGVDNEGVAVTLAAADAPCRFVPGRRLLFQGAPWHVLSAARDEGMITVKLAREVGR